MIAIIDELVHLLILFKNKNKNKNTYKIKIKNKNKNKNKQKKREPQKNDKLTKYKKIIYTFEGQQNKASVEQTTIVVVQG